jgi:hypothetical protein
MDYPDPVLQQHLPLHKKKEKVTASEGIKTLV